MTIKPIEIMSPAGSWESLHAAIQGGANSVYFGIEQLNMRAKSSNNFTLKDLAEISSLCKEKDIDIALAKCSDSVEDWSGGTRIGESLKNFNQFWSRRVLGQGAVLLLISDGLDRDAGRGLELEMERLHKSCRRLIWVNPLLRFEGFEPKSQGIRAILPHVDEFRPVHNLESLIHLITVLNSQVLSRREGMTPWLKAM